MQIHGRIHYLSKDIKTFIAVFVLVLSVGFYTGLLFVNQTEQMEPAGIQENYLGNEEIDNVTIMKFKKGKREVLTIVHTHILSMSFIFFLLGGILATTSINKKLKTFLMIEPFISVIITFGGIYLLWSGVLWFKYIVMISGMLMTLSFTLGVGIVFQQLFKKGVVNK